jgi:uracil DNA glycosylase
MNHARIYNEIHRDVENAKRCLSKKGYDPYEMDKFTKGIAFSITDNTRLTKAEAKFTKNLSKCHRGYGGATPKMPKAEQLTLFGVRRRCSCRGR